MDAIGEVDASKVITKHSRIFDVVNMFVAETR